MSGEGFMSGEKGVWFEKKIVSQFFIMGDVSTLSGELFKVLACFHFHSHLTPCCRRNQWRRFNRMFLGGGEGGLQPSPKGFTISLPHITPSRVRISFMF